MQVLESEQEIVERVIEKVGKTLIIGTPLGAGKANHILNAFYQKALSDKSISLTICTALTLERPKGNSELESRFLGPFVERVFGSYPDLDYELARTTNSLPSNIEVIEFYFPPGKFLHNDRAQQNYISTNYTHVVRDMLDRKINVLTQIVSRRSEKGHTSFSLSCNPDVSVDMVNELESCGYPVATIAQVNQNLPYMLGDAVVDEGFFDFVLDDSEKYFTLFGPPKMSISDADYMIGLYSSCLVKDDGELQIGIGSLGDSTVYNMILRHEQNNTYNELLQDLKINERFEDIIKSYGGTEPFEVGLFGATEMLVDGFMHLYKSGIIKKKVFDHIGLQRLINQGLIHEHFNDDILEILLKNRLIHSLLTKKDVDFLRYWGIFKDDVEFKDGKIQCGELAIVSADLRDTKALEAMKMYCLGERLQHGQIIHGGFFLGPQEFYQWLRELPEAERKLISMRSIQKVNQLYGHESLDRLHRKNARFINSCMKYTLSGAAVSDGLENGKVVSGVGGQYNFVAMAQELPDGNSILNLRSTRVNNGKVVSNIVPFYGHITIPRHLRDIVVTEYGIAFIRGKTDAEIIKELLNITDSRFQEELMNWAKKVGKLESNYQIPEIHKNNFPSSYEKVLKKYKALGHFLPFPFGTDLNETEIKVGKALKALKKDQASKFTLAKNIFNGLLLKPRDQDKELLDRMELLETSDFKEKIYQALLLDKFKTLYP